MPFLIRVGCYLALVLVAQQRVADAGVVAGRIDAPPAPAYPEPRHPGFIKRRPNAVLPPQPQDVYSEMLVMLVPTSKQTIARQPQLAWDVLGESFAQSVVGIGAGGEVLIRNRGKRQVTLRCEEKADLLETKPLNVNAPLALTPSTVGIYTIVDKESRHLRGTLVVGESRLITSVDNQGRFEFADVPAGTYKTKVFFRSAWVERNEEAITVVEKGRIDVAVKLPSYGVKS